MVEIESNSMKIIDTEIDNIKKSVSKSCSFSNNQTIERPHSSSNDLKTISYDGISTQNSFKFMNIKNNLNFISNKSLEKNRIDRKDIYGNIIKKGGNHKVSFRDNIKGNLLVEMTLIDQKQNSLRGKNYKTYTIFREARDKEEILCSGLCCIF